MSRCFDHAREVVGEGSAVPGTCGVWVNGEPAELTDRGGADDEVAVLPRCPVAERSGRSAPGIHDVADRSVGPRTGVGRGAGEAEPLRLGQEGKSKSKASSTRSTSGAQSRSVQGGVVQRASTKSSKGASSSMKGSSGVVGKAVADGFGSITVELAPTGIARLAVRPSVEGPASDLGSWFFRGSGAVTAGRVRPPL